MATYWENSCSFGLRYVSWFHLIVSLVFSHLGFWSGKHFLIAPVPDLCLVPFLKMELKFHNSVILSKFDGKSGNLLLHPKRYTKYEASS